MNKNPLTVEEVKEAADIFFPIYEHIKSRMPGDAPCEDTLKVVENVCNLAQKLRVLKELDSTPFGFNKKTD